MNASCASEEVEEEGRGAGWGGGASGDIFMCPFLQILGDKRGTNSMEKVKERLTEKREHE